MHTSFPIYPSHPCLPSPNTAYCHLTLFTFITNLPHPCLHPPTPIFTTRYTHPPLLSQPSATYPHPHPYLPVPIPSTYRSYTSSRGEGEACQDERRGIVDPNSGKTQNSSNLENWIGREIRGGGRVVNEVDHLIEVLGAPTSNTRSAKVPPVAENGQKWQNKGKIEKSEHNQ